MVSRFTDLYDDFGTVGLNNAIWGQDTTYPVTMLSPNGVQLNDGSYVQSRASFDLKGSRVYWRVDAIPTGGYALLNLTAAPSNIINGDAGYVFQWVIDAANYPTPRLVPKYSTTGLNGTFSQFGLGFPRDAVKHRYLSIRADTNGRVYWEVSSNGTNWLPYNNYLPGTAIDDGVNVPVSAASANTVNYYPAIWPSDIFTGGTVTIIGTGAQASKIIGTQDGGLITTTTNFSPTPTVTTSKFTLKGATDKLFDLAGMASMKIEMINQLEGAGTLNIGFLNTRRTLIRPPLQQIEEFTEFQDGSAIVWGQTYGTWYTLDDNRSNRGPLGLGTDIRIDHIPNDPGNKVMWMDASAFSSGKSGSVTHGGTTFSDPLAHFVATDTEGNSDVNKGLEINGVSHKITAVGSTTSVTFTPAYAGPTTTAAAWRVPGGSTTVRTDIKLNGKKWSIKNVDITCDLLWQQQDPALNEEEKEYSVPRIMWRMQEQIATDFPGATPNPDKNQHYELQIGSDRLTLLIWKAGVVKNLGEIFPVRTDFNKWYRFRVVHSGSTIVVFRDGGEGSQTYHQLNIELGRFRDAELTQAGNVGFTNSGGICQWDKIRVKEGIAPPVLPEGLPMKARKIGAFIERDGATMMSNPDLIYNAETDLGRSMDIVSWYYGTIQPRNPATGATTGDAFNEDWPAGALEFANKGKSNLISWETYGTHFADFLTGMYDDVIDGMIAQVNSLPTLTYLRIFPEMNGNWAPWTVSSVLTEGTYDYASSDEAALEDLNEHSNNVASTAQFRAVWRYIVGKFRNPATGAKNARFVFCVNNVDIGENNSADFYYSAPGDSIENYIDIFGIDGYNWTERTLIQLWSTPAQTWDTQYKRFLTLDENKPIWITETSSGEPHKYRNTFENTPLAPVETDSGALAYGEGSYGEGSFGVVSGSPADITNFADVGGTVEYSNDYKLTGSNVLKMTGPDAYVKWNFSEAFELDGLTHHIEAANFEMYFYYPTAMDTDLVKFQGGLDTICQVHLNVDGTLSCTGRGLAASFSTLGANSTITSTKTYGPGKWWRIEIQATCQDGFDADNSGALEDGEAISNFQVRMYPNTDTAMVETLKMFVDWDRSFADDYEGVDSIYINSDSDILYIDEMSATPDGWVEQMSKGQWYDELLNYRGMGNVQAVCFFWIEKERSWPYWSTPETQDSIKTSFSSGGNLQLDLEYYPQFKPFGVDLSAKAAHIEYMYMAEDNAIDFNICPSYGDVWYKDHDFGEGTPKENKTSRAGRDGSDDDTKLIGEKAVSLQLVLLNTDIARAAYYMDLVKRWGNPARRPRIVYKYFGQPESYINVRRSQLSRAIPETDREVINVNVTFVGYDGKDYETEQQYLDIVAQDDDTLNVSGAVNTEPVIRFYGPLTNPTVYNDTIESSGETLARVGYTGIIAAGEFVEFDMKTGGVWLNGLHDDSADRVPNMSDNYWFPLTPNRTTIRVESEDVFAAGAVKGFARVYWRNAR